MFNLRRTIALLALMSAAPLVLAGEVGKKVQINVTFADGETLQLTQVEGKSAEVQRDGDGGFRLGITPSVEGSLVVLTISDLTPADGERVLAKISGPVGTHMTFDLSPRAGATSGHKPTLDLVAEKVF